MFFGKSKQSSFMDILEKMQSKIEGWRSKTLSQGRKSVFMFLDILCHRLDTTFKNILWGFPKGKNWNLTLKSWNSLCLPKDQGGMGFRLMKDINVSLITNSFES
jgi:hypothetical protein